MENIKIVTEQRKRVIISTTIFVFLGAITNVLGLMGHQGKFFTSIVLAFSGMLVISLLLLFFAKKPPILGIIVSYMIIAEFMIGGEMIFFAYKNIDYSKTVILANMALLYVVLLMSISSYLPKLSYLLAVLTITIYTICAFLTNDKDLWDLYIIFILIFGLGATLCSMITREMRKIVNENAKYKIDAQDLLATLNLTEAEFIAHIELAKINKTKDRKTLDIFDLMGNGAREMLKKNVTYLVEQDKIIYDKIGEFIPEFTPSEVEIARLIVEGKKITEMIPILGKKKSNITCQRSNMRGKLNLTEKDNLKDAIIKRVIIE